MNLGDLLFKEALRYIGRIRHLFVISKSQTTSINRMRRYHFPITNIYRFGCKGFTKPPKVRPENRERRLIPYMYLGPGRPNGGGARVVPLNLADEVEVIAAFRPFMHPEYVLVQATNSIS